ncbi:MAG: T9SS type B sorting domain-containing protein, partial [Chitinophagaceae bacterium]
TICQGTLVNLTLPAITAGSETGLVFSYWTNAAGTNPLSNPAAVGTSGTYYINSVNSTGCNNIKPVIVTFYKSPNASLKGGGTICKGESRTLDLTFTGSAPFNFTFNDGTNTTTITGINNNTYQFTVTPLVSTTYTVTNYGDANCQIDLTSLSEIVAVVQILQPIRYPDVVATPNVPLQLTVRNLGSSYTYSWAPPTGLNNSTIYNPVYNYDKQTEYLISITSDAGCKVVDTLKVVLLSQLPPLINVNIYVPKAWSPNTDGHNDKLFPMTANIRELKFFKIFNRWGQLVFQTNVLGFGWDGIFNGKPQVIDSYTWMAEAIGIDGRYYKAAGNSILLR